MNSLITKHCPANPAASKKGSDPNGATHPSGSDGDWGLTPFSVPPPQAVPLSKRQQRIRRWVLGWFGELTGGTIDYCDGQRTITFGCQSSDSLKSNLRINDGSFYSQLAWGGALGMAESYLRGQWQTDDLTSLLRIFCRNLNRISQSNTVAVKIANLCRRFLTPLQGNTTAKSRLNIAAHYDLSNDFFQLFLDPTMMYSSAYFERETYNLHDASIAKLDRICQKLQLKPSDSVLEIGSGWGGFALHACKQFGANLTTTTISGAQYQLATQRFATAGITDRVRLLNSDYRNLTGRYDKLVSIEMVEAVGEKYLDSYFRQCGRLLKPGGRFVLQAIVMPEQRYRDYRRGDDYIRRYIFPGGFLPSVSAIQESIGRTSDLRLTELEDLSSHYSRTLKEWRRRFLDRIADVRGLGFDDRFIRMWEYYLCYCEAAFSEQAVRVVQVVWDKPNP